MSKNTFRDKLKISAILEKDSNTPKESHRDRIGRTGVIENLNYNTPLYFRYLDGHGTMITSDVEDFEETDYGVWVYTKNTIYIFDDFREPQQDNDNEEILKF